jgi:NAD(P)-dependent dehydrogenase (short-subunit alcohol dehydrogenase family)
VPVALVTGAANGIGRAIALRLPDDGFQVAMAGIEPVEAAGGVTGYQPDVAGLDAHEPLVSRMEQELGPLAARGSGRIVSITSVHATVGEAGALAYDSARAGLEAATRTLAIEPGPRGVSAGNTYFTAQRMVVDGGLTVTF